jgi:hypothetical protein
VITNFRRFPVGLQGFLPLSSGHLIAISRTELFRDCNRVAFDFGLCLNEVSSMKSPVFPLLLFAAVIIPENPLKAGDYCPGFEIVPAATLLFRDSVNPYQFEVFQGYLALGYCDSGCPTTNVIVEGGSVVSCEVTPPVLEPNGGLIVIDCTVIQDSNSDEGTIILDLPCTRVITNAFVFPPLPPPTIVSEPADVETVPGGEASFAVEAQYALEYQWQKDGIDLKETGHTQGANSPVLRIPHVGMHDAGYYSVTVRNPAGVASSLSATLIALPPSNRN